MALNVISIQINGNIIVPEYGIVLKGELTETLNSGYVIFYSDVKLDIDSFDCIKYTINGIETYQVVDVPVENEVGFDNGIASQWEYILTTMSESKLLERITCPASAVTQSKIGTERHSIYYYIQKYTNLYAPKIKVGNNTSFNYQNKWSIAPRVATKFDTTCDEMMWNNPTLRDIFNDLFSSKFCLPILNNHG